jgi:hypothetical protein
MNISRGGISPAVCGAWLPKRHWFVSLKKKGLCSTKVVFQQLKTPPIMEGFKLFALTKY